MAGRAWGRDFVNRRYDAATRKNAEEAERVKQGGTKRRPPAILSGPFEGSIDAIDWMKCGCGYRRPTSGGKPVPQRLDPAYADWSENTSDKPNILHKAIRKLCTQTYKGLIGYHHNVVSLGTDPGYMDLTLWGPGEPNFLFREEKSMTGTWRPGQREHLLAMHQLGMDVGVWKPCCWLSGLIDLQVAQLAGVPPRSRGAQRLKGTLGKPLTWQDVAAGALDDD